MEVSCLKVLTLKRFQFEYLVSANFSKTGPICQSKQYSLGKKLKLYKSNVGSVVLYGAEAWLTNQKIESKLRETGGV